MSRLLRSTGATISVTLTKAGEPVEAEGLPTVVITRENGESLVASSASTKDAAKGVYTYTLTPAQTALVDILKAEWTAKIGGVAGEVFTTHHEIVGDTLASLSAIEASLPAGTTANEAELQEALELAEDWLEDACGVAFRPRYARDELDGTGGLDIRLVHPRPLALRTIKLGSITGANRTALTESEVNEVQLYPGGKAFRLAGWWPGRLNVEVTYEHGYRQVPKQVNRAAVRLARHFLIEDVTDYDGRASSISTEQAHYTLITPGLRGAITAIPEVNVVIENFTFMGVG